VMAFNNLTINSNYDMTCVGGGGGGGGVNNFCMNFPSTLETINEDSIKELLGALR
jgi:hypothetical protein